MTVRNDIVATLVADGGPRPVSELLWLGGRSSSRSGRRAPALALVGDRAGDERRAARPLPDVPAPALQAAGAADGRRRGRAAGLDANAAAAVGIPPLTPPRTPAEAHRMAHSQADYDLS